MTYQERSVVWALSEDQATLILEILQADSEYGNLDSELRQQLRDLLQASLEITDEIHCLLDAYPIRGYGIGAEIKALETALNLTAEDEP